MKWDIEKAVLQAQHMAHMADNQMMELSLLKPQDKMQLLFDLSKFECQRVTILELLELATGKKLGINPYDGRVHDILFAIGTPIVWHDDHAYHRYMLGDVHIICQIVPSKRWHRPTMQAMAVDGSIGDPFMVYGLEHLGFRFEKDLNVLATFFSRWPSEVSEASEHGALIRALGAER